MKYPDAAEAYKIPLGALNELRKKNILWSNDLLSDEELTMVKGIALIWGCTHFLRKQLSQFSIKRREAIIGHPKLSKPERFIFNRIMKLKMTNPAAEVHVHQLASEVIFFFKISDDEKTFKKMLLTAKRMRRKANYELQKLRKK